MAGCALWVRVSSSSGPSHMSRESGTPSASSMAAKVSRAAGKPLGQVLPHPDLLRALARDTSARSPPDDRAAPGEARRRTRPAGRPSPGSDATLGRRPGRARAGSRPTTCCRSGRRSPSPCPSACPACLAVASMMRRLAWCGISRSISVGGDAGPPERLVARLGHRAHRGLEHLAAGHLHVVRPLADHLLADRVGRAAAGPVQQRREPAVGLDEGREDAAPRPRRRAGRTAAPAPSPNRIAVERSCKSVMVESFSAPTTSTVSLCPDGDEPLGHGERVDEARDTPRRCRRPRRSSAPSSAWRSQAVEGSSRSGVAVASTMRVELAGADARALPWRARSPPGSAWRRSAPARRCAARGCRCARRSTRRRCRASGVEVGVGEDAGRARRPRRSRPRRRDAGSCAGRGLALRELGRRCAR